MSQFEIEIINYFEMNDPIAEVYYDSIQFADISWKEEEIVIKFYSHPQREYWEFPYEEALKTFEKAKGMLLKRIHKGNLLHAEIFLDPQQVNEQAEKILAGILNHPEKKIVQGKLEGFGNIVDIYAPDMGGARYSSDGKFIGFLEP